MTAAMDTEQTNPEAEFIEVIGRLAQVANPPDALPAPAYAYRLGKISGYISGYRDGRTATANEN